MGGAFKHLGNLHSIHLGNPIKELSLGHCLLVKPSCVCLYRACQVWPSGWRRTIFKHPSIHVFPYPVHASTAYLCGLEFCNHECSLSTSSSSGTDLSTERQTEMRAQTTGEVWGLPQEVKIQ